MGLLKARDKKAKNPEHYLVKRCPECFINLPMDATKCYSCKTKVGDVDHYGKAKKKTNWYSYIICIGAWGFLIVYIGWAFF